MARRSHKASLPGAPRLAKVTEPAAIDGFRKAILERLSRFTLAGALIVIAIVILQLLGSPRYIARTWAWMVMLGLMALLLAGACMQRLSAGKRGALLIVGCSIPALWIVVRAGFLLPHAHTGMMLTVVLATLLRGARCGLWVLAFHTLALMLIGTAFVHELLSPQAFSGLDVRLSGNWVRTTVAFVAVGAIAVSAIGFLLSRLSQALRQSDALLQAVVDQSARRIAALEEQQALASQLRQSQKLDVVGKLAGGVAHDFNNLLVVMLNNAELARDRSQDPEVREQLSCVVEAAERAGLLTHQLLSFGSRDVLKREAIAVNPAVERTLSLVRRLLPSNISLHFRPGTDAGHIWANNTDIDQILINLCVNARDAMPSGGQLVVETGSSIRSGPDSTPEPYVHLAVTDTGHGIDPVDQGRIFEAFYTTKTAGRNTGLGLSVVRRILGEGAGQIEVNSTVGHGARFDIYWPQCPPPVTTPSVRKDEATRAAETVLVVDDDQGARRAIAAQLTAAGYRVLESRDGMEALRCFDDHRDQIALVITDVVMPGLDGQALGVALAERAPELPLLLCSGYAADAVSADFLEHPLRAFLAKPFAKRELLAQARALIEQAAQAKPGDGALQSSAVFPGVTRPKYSLDIE